MAYTVTASFTAKIANSATAARTSAVDNSIGNGERLQIDAAARAGLRELKGIALRYGFEISDEHVTVEEA